VCQGIGDIGSYFDVRLVLVISIIDKELEGANFGTSSVLRFVELESHGCSSRKNERRLSRDVWYDRSLDVGHIREGSPSVSVPASVSETILTALNDFLDQQGGDQLVEFTAHHGLVIATESIIHLKLNAYDWSPSVVRKRDTEIDHDLIVIGDGSIVNRLVRWPVWDIGQYERCYTALN
jgi:hypothetical protein